jgi:hypothetical protein
MSAKKNATFRPTLDVLEDRCLLAAGLGHGLHLGHRPHSNNGLHLGQHHQHHNNGLHLGQHKQHHNNGNHNGQGW